MDSIIMEIRAGTGGEEAGLFAYDLYKMYSKYAERQGFMLKVIEQNKSETGGIKQITFSIKGNNVYEKLRNEAGVHRVQRVPKTEKNNRIHTSAASVAVLKQTQQAEVEINSNDLEYDFFCSSGKGGQNVNKRQTAIRITHKPSGIVASSQQQRNLEQNRQFALTMLKQKLLNMKQQAISGKVAEERKEQIGTADRSEKIRTYNYPQNRITDHLLNKKYHNLERIMDGRLDKIIG